jgi:hypothetical protein
VAGYSGTPLVRKLGIAPGSALLLDGAPKGFTIDDLPPGVVASHHAGDARGAGARPALDRGDARGAGARPALDRGDARGAGARPALDRGDARGAGARPALDRGDGPYDVILCFCRDRAQLERRWPVMHVRTTPAGALWIAWPKRASGVATDLDENVVRGHALANGRVDVKVAAIDETWSGLKNVIRKADRPA